MSVSSLFKSLDYARYLLADCDAWRIWVGTEASPATQTQARNRIHQFDLPPPADDKEYTREESEGYRPYCLVLPPQDESRFQIIADTTSYNRASGQILFSFEDDIPPELRDNNSEAFSSFLDKVCACVEEMGELSLGPITDVQYLAVRQATLLGYYWARKKDVIKQGNWLAAEVMVEW